MRIGGDAVGCSARDRNPLRPRGHIWSIRNIRLPNYRLNREAKSRRWTGDHLPMRVGIVNRQSESRIRHFDGVERTKLTWHDSKPRAIGLDQVETLLLQMAKSNRVTGAKLNGHTSLSVPTSRL